MKKIVSILIVITLLLLFTSCDLTNAFMSDEDKIEQTISSFVDAYNDGDVEKALEYMTGKSKNALKSVLNLVEIFTGYNASEIFAAAFSIGVAASEGDFMEIEIKEITIENDNAKASVIMRFSSIYNTEEAAYFHLEKKNGEWLTSNITE